MINLAISVFSSLLGFVILWLALPQDYRAGAGFAAFVIFFGLNYFLSKRILTMLEVVMNQVTKELQNQKFDKAIKTLKSAYKLGDWQFFVKPQIESQIGSIYYLTKDDDNAMAHLKNGFSKHWVGMGMLAILYMKKKDKDMMVQTFEKAVKATPKEGMLWSLYAWCILKEGDRDKALEILSRGMAKLPTDEKLKTNHTAVANKERMKMKGYGEMWMQFYLEKTPQIGQKVPHYLQALAGGRNYRKMVRR